MENVIHGKIDVGNVCRLCLSMLDDISFGVHIFEATSENDFGYDIKIDGCCEIKVGMFEESTLIFSSRTIELEFYQFLFCLLLTLHT